MDNRKKLGIIRLLNLAAVDMITDCEFWSSVGSAFTDTINRTIPRPTKTPIEGHNRLLVQNIHSEP